MGSEHDADGHPDPLRRRLLVATSVAGGAAVAATALPFIASLTPSERARALGAPVEADIAKLRDGEMTTVEWRGQPVWILRRTPEMIERLDDIDDQLLDPASVKQQQPPYCQNAARSIKPEIFVAVGLCTHLGCVPTFRPEVAPRDLGKTWSGGYYCPCHGSKFDLAGRVYKHVPAPSNLVIPKHKYLSDTQLLIGKDDSDV
ncbi:ubiquinol-cytochrome c reductase iron-sulfur subunit [Aromatoleum evansii]|uniref:ubiquinol-cytochrome c reductase iron-sulfur subunit n=1 Tax=Aromatoleum evansii TaxID=59406 RepID=UPI00169BB553|nr:ubiquinol-cytochrome c reductase iron-sulfur subunit [Aromatoleum evansii]NMG29977.1 ubiquinol-cytochrome c reductase iron-sulfur subunit [Aromatoleum evansii]